MFSAGGVSTRVRIVQTITSSQTWTAPATTTRLEIASGYGARGSDTSTISQPAYQKDTNQINTRRSDGVQEITTIDSQVIIGTKPSNYCDPATNWTIAQNPTYSSTQYCYIYANHAPVESDGGPTTGASTTAFNKTFPGSTGSGAPATTTFTNVAVTPNTPYTITVPTGGSLTITYYK